MRADQSTERQTRAKKVSGESTGQQTRAKEVIGESRHSLLLSALICSTAGQPRVATRETDHNQRFLTATYQLAHRPLGASCCSVGYIKKKFFTADAQIDYWSLPFHQRAACISTGPHMDWRLYCYCCCC